MENTFIIIATIMFMILSIAWGKRTFIDVLLKVFLIIMSIYGIMLILVHYGYLKQI